MVELRERIDEMQEPTQELEMLYKSRMKLGFSLFFIFLAFYLGAAILTTPDFKNIADMPVMGLPFGLVVSVAVFPVSWLLMGLFFRYWR